MLRQAQREDTPLGRKVKEIMQDGGLVDDDTMLNLVKEPLAHLPTERVRPPKAVLDAIMEELR